MDYVRSQADANQSFHNSIEDSALARKSRRKIEKYPQALGVNRGPRGTSFSWSAFYKHINKQNNNSKTDQSRAYLQEQCSSDEYLIPCAALDRPVDRSCWFHSLQRQRHMEDGCKPEMLVGTNK